jgi:UDP-N-acetylglucosamine 2-epimerase
MKIVSVVGARPQFIKSAPVSIAITQAGHHEFLLHTGQHYDYGMSEIFFEELGIKAPSLNLGVGSGTHAQQTGQMLIGIEAVLLSQKPDVVLVYGDTNSTLAGALAAVKLQIKLAHIEAGLRSYNRQMPEEHNRVLTDHCSDLLFCPTRTALENLAREGITNGVHLVGDTMYDAVSKYGDLARTRSKILQQLDVKTGCYLLATIHRPYNTDDADVLRTYFSAFGQVDERIIFPIHPRTQKVVISSNLSIPGNVKLLESVGYLDMLMLEQNARLILTDSGGIQKEAYFFKIPCLTLRPETEWVETIVNGWNKLVGCDSASIIDAITTTVRPAQDPAPVFGDGNASTKIVNFLNI